MDAVLVLSANFKKAYPIIASLNKAGLRVIGGFYRLPHPNMASRHLSKLYTLTNPYKNEKLYIRNVIEIIKKSKPKIIIPVGFIDNITLAKYRDLLEPLVLLPIPNYEIIKRVSDKTYLIKIAKEVGLKYPKTIIVNDKTDIEKLPIKYPVVIKGFSDASHPEFAISPHKAKNILSKRGRSLIQEFILGTGHGYFALATRGEVLVEFMHIRLIEKTPLGGPSIAACSYIDKKLAVLGRKLINYLKWTGIIMIEFRKDLETGEYYLLEINPKFWGSLELACKCGVDFPRYLVDLFLYNKKPEHRTYPSNICFYWILNGTNYLKINPVLFTRLLINGIKNLFYTDLHINDPLHAIYSLINTSANSFKIMKNLGRQRKFYSYSLLNATKSLFKFLKTSKSLIIISDLDGTLINLKIPWKYIRNVLINRYNIINSYETLDIAFYRAIYLNKFKELNNFVKKFEKESIKYIKPDRILINIIEKIKRDVDAFCVVSKQPHDVAEEVLKRLGVLNYIDKIIGRDEVFLREEQIKQCIKRNSKAIMIGDRLNDAVSAIRGEVYPILISNCLHKSIKAILLEIPIFRDVKHALKTILTLRRSH